MEVVCTLINPISNSVSGTWLVPPPPPPLPSDPFMTASTNVNPLTKCSVEEDLVSCDRFRDGRDRESLTDLLFGDWKRESRGRDRERDLETLCSEKENLERVRARNASRPAWPTRGQ